MNSDSRLSRLRGAIEQAHDRIETVPILSRLLAADLAAAEYVVLLQRLHAFHAAAEPAIALELAGWPSATVLLDGARIRALADDLAWFAASPVQACDGPEFASASAAMGALYVIEGSGLGGRVIARHLTASLGVTVGRGGSFYCRLDADTARRRWGDMTALLESPGLDEEQLVHGAKTTFAYLERWLRAGPQNFVAGVSAYPAEATLR